jgi:SAM-dependent methyltransferase
MLKNDEVFWVPGADVTPVGLSWGSSEGDFGRLWEHSQRRWRFIQQAIARAGAPPPGGRILEFGAGLGLLDDLLDGRTSALVMVDHTDAYLAARPRPLSARCRHVQWSARGLEELLTETASYDWLISIAVFYHVEGATAASLILELGRLVKPGGHVLIEGWNTATPEKIRAMATRERLFSRYPTYPIDLDLLGQALAPEYEELSRENILLYRKTAGGHDRPRITWRTRARALLTDLRAVVQRHRSRR